MLVALLRQHFQLKQEKHTHRGLLPPKPRTSSRPTSASVLDENQPRLTVPALTRAKMAITNSFENLRSKSGAEKRRKQNGTDAHEDKEQENQQDLKTSSLNTRSLSPLFARKTSIDTLMAPVTTSPLNENLERGRGRSYTAGAGEILRAQPIPSGTKEQSKEEEKEQSKEEEKDHRRKSITESVSGSTGEREEVQTPRRNTTAKRRTLSDQQQHPTRHAMTPPSTSAEKHLAKGHKRSTSTIVSRTWRQEIFVSVCTPGKLEHRSDSDICEFNWVMQKSSSDVVYIGSGRVAGDRYCPPQSGRFAIQ